MNVLEKLNLSVEFSPAKHLVRGLIFDSKKSTYNSFLQMIVQIDVGLDLTLEQYEDAMPIIAQPINCFEKRHKDIIDYSRFFITTKYCHIKGNFQNKHSEETKISESQALPLQIKSSFQTVLHKVVSMELLGNNRNKKKILKTLFNLLKTAKHEPFTLIHLLKKLKVSIR